LGEGPCSTVAASGYVGDLPGVIFLNNFTIYKPKNEKFMQRSTNTTSVHFWNKKNLPIIMICILANATLGSMMLTTKP